MRERRFGRYILHDKIGHGGMATVYRAFDTHREVDVALKLLPTHLLNDQILRRRFEREAKTIIQLEHYAIVPVYDYGKVEGQPFLAMRLMRGDSLTERLKQGPLSFSLISQILDRIGAALDKAHSSGIIHRDIKPGNILFDEEGMPYLADFGIASLENVTATLAFSGTPHYMAPEQIKGLTISARTDIYQLGAVLFEMLTGATPYSGNTATAILYKHVNAPIPDLCQANHALPPQFQKVIDRALAKDPARRYGSAGALTDAFKQCSASTSSKSANRLRFLIGFAMLLLLACATAGYLQRERVTILLTRSSATPETMVVNQRETVIVVITEVVAATRVPTFLPISPTPTRSAPTPINTSVVTPIPQFTTALGGGTGVLAFARDDGGGAEIYVANLDGSGERRLTNLNGDAYRPVWSPDGSKIAFHSEVNDLWDIYVMNANGSDLHKVTTDAKDDAFPAWSPDGSLLAFHSNRDGDYELYVMTAEGADLAQLTFNDQDDLGVTWAPDGAQIAYARLVGRQRQIFTMDLQTLEEQQLTSTGSNDSPAWSPRGDAILFVSRRDGNSEIYMINPGSKIETRLTFSPHSSYYPAWSPDAQWIAFHRNIDGNREIFLMDSERLEPYQWSETTVEEWQPAWQPDPAQRHFPAPQMRVVIAPRDCTDVTGAFASIWEPQRTRLGCAVSEPVDTWMAEENFENGKLFWREVYDTARGIVVYDNGGWQIVQHESYVEGNPEFSCVDAGTPAQCPPTPKRGFGMLWCSVASVRTNLGNATDCERGYTGTVQLFERGWLLRTDEGEFYAFYGVSNGTWERQEL